jgi:hypothetical protein
MGRVALSAAAIYLQAACLITGTLAQESDLDCNAFVKNSDGSWTVIENVFIPVQRINVREGTVFRPGETFLGEDMVARLNSSCRTAAVSSPAAVQAQNPQVPLSRNADAKGDVDIRTLSCGHLDQTSAEETGLLLSWYSGWYSGIAKKRGINLARVRSAMRNVVDYCKTNRDKSLAQAMDLMLK